MALRKIKIFRRPVSQTALCCAAGVALCVSLPASTESAVANGDTRTLNLYNAHTNESISATYRVDGHYDQAVLEKLNWFLRDWRRNEATHMDPRLFDAVWETYREAGATEPIHVVCGYRSPRTNAMLRRRSHAVAQHSQHMLGKAMDTTMPGMSMEKVREIAMRLEMGGVGFYGDTRFVHIDVGGVRYWPRMTYAQLEHVFPDGKTVLIPTNGKPLPGYDQARAEIAAAGREIAPQPTATATNNGGNLLAWLFGGGKSADEVEEESAQQANANQAPAAPAQSQEQGQDTHVATAEAEAGADSGSVEPVHAAKAGTVALADETDTKDQGGPQIPLPPHRPNEFLALAEAPLPPGRPAPFITGTIPQKKTSAVASGDPIGDLARGSAPAHTASLPSIITDGASAGGTGQGADGDQQALAYVPAAQMEGLRAASHAAASGGTNPADKGMAKLERDMLEPTLTGLRRAGRIEETAALSQKLAAGYLARFSDVATNLPTDHFVGPAVVGLRAADKSRMIFVDGSAALMARD